MAALTGGDKLMAALEAIDKRLATAGTGPSVSAGFLAGGIYPDNITSIPMVAFIQEFGGRIEREPSDPDEGGGQTIYRKVNAAGTAFLRNGRFVKKEDSNFASTHYVGAYVITIPPRPFFRNAIAKYGPKWGEQMGLLLKRFDFDASKTLNAMGNIIQGQIQTSILDLRDPPLAPSTIRRKSQGKVSALAKAIGGPAKPLIDTGLMWNSVSYEVNGA
jgi:hypothetical protein